MKWEYEVATTEANDEQLAKVLNTYGSDGWELVWAGPSGSTASNVDHKLVWKLIFKRPIPGDIPF